jgi:hypothetical protein
VNDVCTDASCNPAARCSTGNSDPTVRSVLDRLVVGMNTPERNHSGSVVACTIGWAASGDPIMPETA